MANYPQHKIDIHIGQKYKPQRNVKSDGHIKPLHARPSPSLVGKSSSYTSTFHSTRSGLGA